MLKTDVLFMSDLKSLRTIADMTPEAHYITQQEGQRKILVGVSQLHAFAGPQVWDPESLSLLRSLPAMPGAVTALSGFSSTDNSPRIVAACRGVLKIYDPEAGEVGAATLCFCLVSPVPLAVLLAYDEGDYGTLSHPIVSLHMRDTRVCS
jgi:hypothetical protein